MNETVAWFVNACGKPLLFLLVLAGVDLLTGLGSALRRGVFDFPKIGTFYQRTVLPYLLGWVSLSVLAYLATLASLPPELTPIANFVVSGTGYTVVAGTLIHSIATNLLEIFPQRPSPDLGRLG